MQITYADRETFLETFRAQEDSLDISDAQLLQDTASYATRIQPRYGFEEGLTRDLLILSNYLAHHANNIAVAGIARGALGYVLKAEAAEGSALSDFGLLDDAFIAGFGVHEIRTRLGETAHYSAPKLTPIEQRHAEELFLGLFERTSVPDALLATKSIQVVNELGILGESGIFRRLRNNVTFLAGVLNDPGRTSEHHSIARAALHYLIEEQDAIPDSLGLAGYLDDNFIAQLAVDFIEPRRDPWLELLDSLVAAWPFLGNMVITESESGCALSEFILANSAFACPHIRGTSGVGSLTVVTPSPGPLPFVLGFLSAIGAMYESCQNDQGPRLFQIDQRVLVDFTCIRTFAGYRTENAQEFFGLKHTRRERGQTLASIQWWPASEIHRLIPAPTEKRTRGQLRHSAHDELIVPALDFILALPHTHSSGQRPPPVYVATQIAEARDLAGRLSVYGQALSEIIPMGHLSGVDEFVPWSTRFGAQSPLLVVTSDLDYASEYVDDSGVTPRLVIVDGSGRNADRTASVARFTAQHVPVITIAGIDTATPGTNGETQNIVTWQWTKEDFDTLLGPSPADESQLCLGRFERSQRRTFESKAISVRAVDLPCSDDVFKSLNDLKKTASARDNESAPEIDEFLARAFPCFVRLLRALAPLQSLPNLHAAVKADLVELARIASGCQFLTHDEKTAAAMARDGLDNLAANLTQANPKAEYLRSVFATTPDIVIACQDPEGIRSAAAEILGKRVRLVSLDSLLTANNLCSLVIIPAWFGRSTMCNLLIPPVADSISLALYDVEKRWYGGFTEAMRRSREGAVRPAKRANLFPGIGGWKEVRDRPDEPVPSSEEVEYDASEELNRHIRDLQKRRFLAGANADDAEANVDTYFVMFEGNRCAFLSKSYRAKVATHLLNGLAKKEDADLELRQAPQLKPGDAVLFRRGTSSDVIRPLADKMVPAGTRELSSLWRTALRSYVDRLSLSVESLRTQLNSSGCPLSTQAIRNWLTDDEMIAPLSYARDIGAILALTDDRALRDQFDASLDAIAKLRSAHLRASHVIAEQVIDKAVQSMRSGSTPGGLLEIDDRLVIVRVEDLDGSLTRVRSSLVNRLLEDDAWRE